MINFSSALILFSSILIIIYLVILLRTGKSKVYKRRFKAKTANIVAIGLFVSMFLLIIFQRLWNTSVIYFILYPFAVFLLLMSVVFSSASNRVYLFVSVVILHLIAMSLVFPSSGIFITERTPALVKIEGAKSWNSEWGMLNSYYNPFPMDLGLAYAFSAITSIAYTDLLSVWIITFLFLIAYVLILFSVAKSISGSWIVGVLSVLLLTFTPPLMPNPQPQWLASLFIFVFIWGLFKALKDSPSISNVVLINLSYAVAILFHGTAAIGAVFVSILFLFIFLGNKMGLNIVTSAHHRSFVYVVLTSVYAMTLGRWLILGGIEPIMTPLMGVVKDILGYGEISWIGSQYVPLYDQFVSPLGAYAWSVPISLAFAYVLYHFVRHDKKKALNVVFAQSMGVTAAGLVFAGFIGSIFLANANLQRYLGYAGMPLLIPVAGIACAKVLRSFSWKIVSVCLISIVLFSGIARFDPAVSPQLYRTIKTVSPTGSADLIEGNTLYEVLSERNSIVSTYEILTALSYLMTAPESSGKNIRFYAGSLKTHRIMMEKMTEEKIAVPGVMYIWSPEILDLANETLANVVYDSGRHVAVGRGL